MALTPSDVEKKTFATALRGYDLDEVDDFLDDMVVALRELQDELVKTKARVAEIERDPDAAAAVAAGPDESAVGRALVAAQQTADRMLDDARTEADRLVEESRSEADRRLEESRTEADRVLEEARSEADTFIKERDQRRTEVEAEMAEMTGLVSGVRNQLAVLATTVADKLDEMDGVLSGAHTKMGAVAPEAQGEDSTESTEEETDQASSIWDDTEDDADTVAEEGEESGSTEETSDQDEGLDEGLETDDEVDLDSLEEVDAEETVGSAEIEGIEVLEDDSRSDLR